MGRQSKLSPEQWAVARRRWEGSDQEGFAWLCVELKDAYGVELSRPGVRQTAVAQGWEKGGEPSQALPSMPAGAKKVSPARTGNDRQIKVETTAKLSPTNQGQEPASTKRELIASRVQDESTGLTPPEETFALAVGKGSNQSDAFRQAFPRSQKWKPESVHVAACELAAKPKVKARIQELLSSAASANEADIGLVLKQYLNRLNADPRELTEIRVVACRYCYGKNHRYQYTDGELEDARDLHEEKRAKLLDQDRPDIGPMNEKGGGGYSVLREPNPQCPSCGGAGTNRVMLKDSRTYSPAALALFGGVKQTKDGIEVKLTDRVDVLGHVARHVGFFEADNTPATNVTINMTELDSIYEEALAKARAQEQLARGRMHRIASKHEDADE